MSHPTCSLQGTRKRRVAYDSVADLESHLNIVGKQPSTWLFSLSRPVLTLHGQVMTVKRATPAAINFSQERMCFCYSNIQEHNFIFSEPTQRCLYVIDFEHAAFLPVSFMSYALFFSSPWLAKEVGSRMQSEGISSNSENLQAMAWLQHIFTRCDVHIGKI